MNNEKKLFSSIGMLDDDILHSALEYTNETDNNKGRVLSLKKLTVIALAAVMCIGLVITVSAYGSEIWAAITKRQHELIDIKSQYIKESVMAESGVTLTVDNVASCTGDGLFYFTVHSGKEPFTNGLKYEEFEIYYLTDPALNITYSDYNKPEKMGDWQLLFADDEDKSGYAGAFSFIEKMDYDPEKPTTAVKFQLKTLVFSTKYKIVMRGITSEDGSIKYADELEVEFKVDQSEMQDIAEFRYFKPSPEIEFELDGSRYQIGEISMEPHCFSISLINRDEEVTEYEGREYYYVTRFNSRLWFTREWFDYRYEERLMAFEHPEIFTPEGASEEVMAEYQKISDKAAEVFGDDLTISNYEEDDDGKYIIAVYHPELYSKTYNVLIELKPDCGAKIKEEGPFVNYTTYGLQILNQNPLEMTMCFKKSFAFTSPIYVTDIKRVYITKTSDPDFELTIYEPDKDESLLAYLSGQS